jgi:AraC family transcriptional regulator
MSGGVEPRLAPGTFYGDPLGSRRVAGFLLSQSSYAPGLVLPNHAHEAAFFYLVLQGSSTETFGQQTRTATASTLVFHPAGESHANQWHGAGGQCFHIEIAPSTLDRIREHALILDEPADFQGGWPVWLALRLHNEFQQMDGVSALAIEGLALEMLAEASRRPVKTMEPHPPRWLRQARDLLHARFDESLSLDDIARAAGVHPSHLARVFRQQYCSTVGDYVRQLRIEYACRQLSTSDAPLVEIALAAGFADQSHFSKTFKRLMGLTPAEFQRHFRPRNPDTKR